ncbi:hypothetical protein BC628DRAFT_1041653 [Trametes gibbosa]|nr:hypothetical protein BC628DRAFT_1041653 [Trametes gibbosa]
MFGSSPYPLRSPIESTDREVRARSQTMDNVDDGSCSDAPEGWSDARCYGTLVASLHRGPVRRKAVDRSNSFVRRIPNAAWHYPKMAELPGPFECVINGGGKMRAPAFKPVSAVPACDIQRKLDFYRAPSAECPTREIPGPRQSGSQWPSS